MPQITIDVSEEIAADLERYGGRAADLLKLGIRQLKIDESLVLFRQGGTSIWRAARLAGVPLREMMSHALGHGVQPPYDEEMLKEETG